MGRPFHYFRAGPKATPNRKGAFSRDKAAATLGRASESLDECRTADGPIGPGHLKVTFAPTGEVSDVEVDPPYAGTTMGECIAKKFRRASVPEFEGDPVSVGKTFVLRSADEM